MPVTNKDRIVLVIFDCDGVLVDSELLAAEVLATELTAIGFDLTARECIRRYTGLSMPRVFELIEAERGQPLPAGFTDRLRASDESAFRRSLSAMPGARDVLLRLPQPRCVASSGRIAKIRLTLTLSRLIDLVEPHLFSAEMVEHGKPAPDLFLYAAARMGAAAKDCVVIEDSPAGVQAAVAAGMHVLGFSGGSHCDNDYPAILRQAGATRVFARMHDLPVLIRAI
ncbi:MAG: HAD-IA family hydrolase [Rhodospirillales bacterium]|nr:HAD-IA family hydrolase [Rhodospirillales bacterium]